MSKWWSPRTRRCGPVCGSGTRTPSGFSSSATPERSTTTAFAESATGPQPRISSRSSSSRLGEDATFDSHRVRSSPGSSASPRTSSATDAARNADTQRHCAAFPRLDPIPASSTRARSDSTTSGSCGAHSRSSQGSLVTSRTCSPSAHGSSSATRTPRSRSGSRWGRSARASPARERACGNSMPLRT